MVVAVTVMRVLLFVLYVSMLRECECSRVCGCTRGVRELVECVKCVCSGCGGIGGSG